ncbi:MAG: ABC transporter permease [Bacteroides sp.]|nr:ABC transporter permease [Bacteroides sp.]
MRQIYYTFQTLLRGGGNNVVKLVSLTLGVTVGVLLFSQIVYELSYEECYEEPWKVSLLRYRMQQADGSFGDYDNDAFKPAAKDLWESFPEAVESATVMVTFMQPSLFCEDEQVEEAQIVFADTCYFRTLGWELLRGDAGDLASRQAVFLSEEMARRLFADEDPIGKTISFHRMLDLTVKGIYRELPHSTVFRHNVMLSIPLYESMYGSGTWGSNDCFSVLFRFKDEAGRAEMNARLQEAVAQFGGDQYGNSKLHYELLPLQQIHTSAPDCRQRLAILAVLGFSVFFVAILNYVLAAIATMGRRAKLVGVHKCSGAASGHILGLFMWETGMLVLAAVAGSVLLLHLFREPITELLGTALADLFTWDTLWVPLLTVLLLFTVSGVLPGRMFARIPVSQVFRRYTDSKRSWKRSLLLVQFAGMAFILGMLLTAVWQYQELVSRPVGFNTDRLVFGDIRGRGNQLDIEEALRRQPAVESVSRGQSCLLTHYSTVPLYNDNKEILAPLHFQIVTDGFYENVGLRLLEGRFPMHAYEAVVSRKTVEIMHWENQVIGRVHQMPYDIEPITIVGVVEDVRNMSFFAPPTCTAFILGSNEPNKSYSFNIRVKEPLDENIARLQAFLKESYPQANITLESYDEIQRSSYGEVLRFRNTVWATGCCVLLIVLTGLIGYVAEETGRRSKEIAIRKVNGAEATDILRLLSMDILKVAVAAVLAGIVCSRCISGVWMEQFPDSTLLPWPLFLLTGVAVLLLIHLVVVAKAWRIANENPVKSIKAE